MANSMDFLRACFLLSQKINLNIIPPLQSFQILSASGFLSFPPHANELQNSLFSSWSLEKLKIQNFEAAEHSVLVVSVKKKKLRKESL